MGYLLLITIALFISCNYGSEKSFSSGFEYNTQGRRQEVAKWEKNLT